MKNFKHRILYDGWQKDFVLEVMEGGEYVTWGHYKTSKSAERAFKNLKKKGLKK